MASRDSADALTIGGGVAGRGIETLAPTEAPQSAVPAAPAEIPARLKVAYIVNQYPKVSHSFIRREILAIERQGIAVERIAIRGWDSDIVDTDDFAERTRTRHVLKGGVIPILQAALRSCRADPRRFLKALRETLRLSRGAERSLPYHLMYLGEACLILEWIRAADVSHVHAHFGTNSAQVAMLVHALGGPTYSFTIHGPDEFDKTHMLHLSEKIAGAKFVAAISSYGRAQLFRRTASSDWSKIKIIHCGLERDFRAADGEVLPSENRLVCVGRLCEQKGQLVLLEAFARLKSRVGDCHLVLAGDGEMRPEIEARIAALDLKSSVTVTGWISGPDVRKEILAAKALVLPSFQEGLPVVLMEAMALRRPVISTYVAGIPELVTPGETGWLVPAASITPLVEAMEACLKAPAETLQRMGDAAFRQVTARHDVDIEAAKLIGLFQSKVLPNEIEEWQS